MKRSRPRRAPPQEPRVPSAGTAVPTWPGAASLVLRPGRIGPLLAGHPWVFAGAIADIHLPPGEQAQAGQTAAVFDQHGRWLGVGTWNPASALAARLLLLAPEGQGPPAELPTLAEIVRLRLEHAGHLRRDLGLPASEQTAFRLVNAEGDGLPGLTVDRYGSGAVALFSTAGAWGLRQTVGDWLLAEGGCEWAVLRVGPSPHPSEGLAAAVGLELGELPAEVEVRHHGLRLFLSPRAGAKSGLFLDQFANHLRVAELARGRFVLDAFCHYGGFGLHAALAGATRVLCIDASLGAVEAVRRHAALAGLSAVQAEQTDAVHGLGTFADLEADAERPSLVIVDPPKFATRSDVIDDALARYEHLNRLALRAVADGGWLVSCSCSGRVEPGEFRRLLGRAARRAGVRLALVELRGPGPDHPVPPAHAEADYLKVAICRVFRQNPGSVAPAA